MRMDAAGAGDATPLGLGIILWTTQGSPALRANLGLKDGIPLGFSKPGDRADEGVLSAADHAVTKFAFCHKNWIGKHAN